MEDELRNCSIYLPVMYFSKILLQSKMKNNKVFDMVCKVYWDFMGKEHILSTNDNYVKFIENKNKANVFQETLEVFLKVYNTDRDDNHDRDGDQKHIFG